MATSSKNGIGKKIWYGLSTSIWTPLVLTAVVIGSVVLVQIFYGKKSKEPVVESVPAPKTIPRMDAVSDSARTAAKRVLAEYRISCRIQKHPANRREIWTAEVSSDIPLPSVHLSLQDEIAKTGAAVLGASSDPATGVTVLQIGREDSCYFQIQLVPSSKETTAAGKIALVIDDFGDRLDDLVFAFFNLDGKITISILPGRKLSAKIAREASNRGCEVILHLSMEPMRAAFQEDGYTILTKMPRAEIQSAFQKALNEVPCAVGVNNHMGSRATSDRQTMVDVLESVKQKGLYFMDSYTVASSVAYGVANELGVPTAKRDVFVDVDGSENAIRQKLRELARRAKENGFAVGIGHCHPDMLRAIQKEMPRIQEEGLRFVPLSEVVQ